MGDIITIFNSEQSPVVRGISVRFEYGEGGYSYSEYPTVEYAMIAVSNFRKKRMNQYKHQYNNLPTDKVYKDTVEYLERLGV